jgi:hypothetical protein
VSLVAKSVNEFLHASFHFWCRRGAAFRYFLACFVVVHRAAQKATVEKITAADYAVWVETQLFAVQFGTVIVFDRLLVDG